MNNANFEQFMSIIGLFDIYESEEYQALEMNSGEVDRSLLRSILEEGVFEKHSPKIFVVWLLDHGYQQSSWSMIPLKRQILAHMLRTPSSETWLKQAGVSNKLDVFVVEEVEANLPNIDTSSLKPNQWGDWMHFLNLLGEIVKFPTHLLKNSVSVFLPRMTTPEANYLEQRKKCNTLGLLGWTRNFKTHCGDYGFEMGIVEKVAQHLKEDSFRIPSKQSDMAYDIVKEMTGSPLMDILHQCRFAMVDEYGDIYAPDAYMIFENDDTVIVLVHSSVNEDYGLVRIKKDGSHDFVNLTEKWWIFQQSNLHIHFAMQIDDSGDTTFTMTRGDPTSMFKLGQHMRVYHFVITKDWRMKDVNYLDVGNQHIQKIERF